MKERLSPERTATIVAVLRRLPHAEAKVIAGRAGLSPITLSRWKHGAQGITPGAARSLAHGMGLTLAELLDEEARD